MTSIAVCVATFGDRDVWDPLAARAVASVLAQTRAPDVVVRVHGPTLHEARNDAVAEAEAEWVVLLDADDELDAGYLEAMQEAIDREGDRMLQLQPATLGVYPDGTEDATAALIPPRLLRDANFLVIGTCVRRRDYLDVGGMLDWDYAEDWCFHQRLALAGAEHVAVPDAVYRVAVRTDGRNNCPRPQQVRTYDAIRRRYAAAWAGR